jgi:hypothetical protein
MLPSTLLKNSSFGLLAGTRSLGRGDVHQQVGAHLGSNLSIIVGPFRGGFISSRVHLLCTLGDQNLANENCMRGTRWFKENGQGWSVHVLKIVVKHRQLLLPFSDPLACLNLV